jgi:DNA-binding winged helix-turn-helix (wHTH) protein
MRGYHRQVLGQFLVFHRDAKVQVKFGDFVLDRGTRQLLRGGHERRLGPKAFELLELLLDQRPNVVARERIRDRLWPDTFVSESTLATLMAEVRAALDESPKRPVFLRTVHGVGFAFCGQALETEPRTRAAGDAPAFRLVLEDREVALHPGENLLGRVEEGVAWFESSTVSRRHARIRVEGGEVILEDLASKNGTFVRGQRISGPTALFDGDVFRLGRVKVTLRSLQPDEVTRSDDGEPPARS